MQDPKMYKCKYCGKSDKSKKRLLGLKCPSHPKGLWKGCHVLDPATEFLADVYNLHNFNQPNPVGPQKIIAQKTTKSGLYGHVTCLASENLRQVSGWMINYWDSESAQTMRMDLNFAFMIARDNKIPKGEIHASWADSFSALQKDIFHMKVWKQIYWMMKVEYNLRNTPISQTPSTLEAEKIRPFAKKVFSTWDSAETKNLVDGFAYGFSILSDRSKAGIIDPSWKEFFDEMTITVLNVEIWERLYWICNVTLAGN